MQTSFFIRQHEIHAQIEAQLYWKNTHLELYQKCYLYMYGLKLATHISVGVMQSKTQSNVESFRLVYFLLSFVLVQIEKSIAKRIQNTTDPGEPPQLKWKSRNNAHLWPIHRIDNKVASGHNKVFDTSSRIKLVQVILVGHIRGLLQILKSLFPLSPSITLQSVPNDLSCFLKMPLEIV